MIDFGVELIVCREMWYRWKRDLRYYKEDEEVQIP